MRKKSENKCVLKSEQGEAMSTVDLDCFRIRADNWSNSRTYIYSILPLPLLKVKKK